MNIEEDCNGCKTNKPFLTEFIAFYSRLRITFGIDRIKWRMVSCWDLQLNSKYHSAVNGIENAI